MPVGRTLTGLRVHAIQYATHERADAVASEVYRDNPGCFVRVEPVEKGGAS